MEHSYNTKIQDILLKPMTREDAERYRVLRYKYREWFGTQSYISKEQQKKWYSRYLIDPNEFMFSIYDTSGNFIGGNSLYHIDFKNVQCEYGRIIVDTDYSGRGYGLKATLGAIEIAREYLGLKRICLEVKEENVKAIKIYCKAGFSISEVSDSSNKMLKMETVLN